MKSRSRIGAVGAALALATAGFFAVGSAGAATVDVATPLITPPSGLVLEAPGGDLSLPAPAGSNFTGTYDDSTGDLDGTVTIASGSFDTIATGTPAGDLPVTIDFEFESGGPITGGNIDGSGNVSFSDTQTFKLTTLHLTSLGLDQSLGDNCAFGPLDLDYTGTYDDTTNTVDASADFEVPMLQQGDCGDVAGIDLAGAIMGALGSETPATSTLSFELGTNEIPTTTSTTTTTVPSAPGVSFTGEFTTDGCDATIPTHFDGAGDYTVQIVTTNDRVLGSTKVHRDAAGDQKVIVSVDPNHGTKHGDPLNVQVLDANGAVVAEQDGTVDDPNACRPTKPTGNQPLATKPASAATPVSAQPAFTG